MQTFKSKSLKKISAIAAAAIGVVSYQPAQATGFNQSGRVANLNVTDLSVPSFIAGNSVSLVGLSSLGNCGTFLGAVQFVFKDDLHGQQMYATALAAAASGSTVVVSADDANRNANGYCFVLNLSFVGN